LVLVVSREGGPTLGGRGKNSGSKKRVTPSLSHTVNDLVRERLILVKEREFVLNTESERAQASPIIHYQPVNRNTAGRKIRVHACHHRERGRGKKEEGAKDRGTHTFDQIRMFYRVKAGGTPARKQEGDKGCPQRDPTEEAGEEGARFRD